MRHKRIYPNRGPVLHRGGALRVASAPGGRVVLRSDAGASPPTPAGRVAPRSDAGAAIPPPPRVSGRRAGPSTTRRRQRGPSRFSRANNPALAAVLAANAGKCVPEPTGSELTDRRTASAGKLGIAPSRAASMPRRHMWLGSPTRPRAGPQGAPARAPTEPPRHRRTRAGAARGAPPSPHTRHATAEPAPAQRTLPPTEAPRHRGAGPRRHRDHVSELRSGNPNVCSQ